MQYQFKVAQLVSLEVILAVCAPSLLLRRATLIHQLKESQHNLMNIIMTLMQQSIPGGRTPCHFRAKYPDDILLDQINGRFELYIVTTGIVFMNIHCV